MNCNWWTPVLTSQMLKSPVTYNFFWQVVQWGKVWGIVFFQTPRAGLTSEKGLHPSQGHMVILGGQNPPFSVAGREMPFPAEIGIARMMKNDSICPKNIRSHSRGLIRPFRVLSGSYLAGFYCPMSSAHRAKSRQIIHPRRLPLRTQVPT